jgi:hypothetical protein
MQNYHYRLGSANFNKERSTYVDDRDVSICDTTTLKKKMSNLFGQWKNPHRNNMTDAYWCRDQNFRKYFEARKRHNIEPSVDVNTFYNKHKAKEYYSGLSEVNNIVKNVKNIM